MGRSTQCGGPAARRHWSICYVSFYTPNFGWSSGYLYDVTATRIVNNYLWAVRIFVLIFIVWLLPYLTISKFIGSFSLPAFELAINSTFNYTIYLTNGNNFILSIYLDIESSVASQDIYLRTISVMIPVAYFGESDRSFRFYPITFSSSFSSLPVLP